MAPVLGVNKLTCESDYYADGSAAGTSASCMGPARSIRSFDAGVGSSSSWNKSSGSQPSCKAGVHGGGAAASVLGMNPDTWSVSQAKKAEKPGKEDFLDLPHSVLQMTAAGLQCDLIVAGLLQSPHGLLETVLCVPKDLINVSLRLSKGLLAKNTCQVGLPSSFKAL